MVKLRATLSSLAMALMFLVFASHPLRADLFLAVDFDLTQPGIQSNAIVDSNNKTTAYLVLFLTGNTDLYAYEFSVRYNADRLTLDNNDDSPPTNVNGMNFVEVLTNDRSTTGAGDGFANYVEINRFDGKLDDPSNSLAITAAETVNGLVLGKLDFTVRGSGDDLLVRPGIYELPDPNGEVKPFDVFLGNSGPIAVSAGSFLEGRILAVPEPSSLFLLMAAGLAWGVRQRLSCRSKR